jgi:hypothetical protein
MKKSPYEKDIQTFVDRFAATDEKIGYAAEALARWRGFCLPEPSIQV